MSQTYRTLSDLMPSQRRRLKLVQPTWVRFTKLDGYQEPRPSDLRHRWAWQENKYAPGGRIVSCEYCACVLTKAGPFNWRCFGAGRP